MNERTARWAGRAIGGFMTAGLLWLAWGWWSYSGLYRLLARLQLRVFGSFGAISTFALGVVLVCGLGTLAFQPLVRRQRDAGLIQRRSPAVAKAMTERAMVKLALGGGVVALLAALAAGALLYRDAERDAVSAVLDLSSPRPLPEGAGRVRLIGFTRPALLVDIESKQTPGTSVSSNGYMAVVGPSWRPGMPVPVVVTGSPGLGLPGTTRPDAEPGATVPFDLPAGYVRGFTSGYATDLLGERGAVVDAHTLFLDTEQDAERNALLPVVILGGLLAALGIAGGLWTRRSITAAAAGGRSSPGR